MCSVSSDVLQSLRWLQMQPHLLDHLRVLLHYVKEAVALLGHGRRSFLRAA